MSISKLIHQYFLQTQAKIPDQVPQELLVNGLNCMIIIMSNGNKIELPSPFQNKDQLISALQEFAYSCGGRLDPNYPANGGEYRQPESAILSNSVIRWHALLPPISRDGGLLSIRRISWNKLQLADFGIGPDLALRLRHLLQSGRSLIVSGPTGSGKTSLLCQLLREGCLDERIIIVESLPEIPNLSTKWVRLCSQAENVEGQGRFDLIRIIEESLRLRPDRLVVGEIRGPEARAWFQALQLAEKGSLASIHVHHHSQLIARLSDLSGLDRKYWLEVFDLHRPVLIQLQRQEPRFREALYFQNGKFNPICSYDQT